MLLQRKGQATTTSFFWLCCHIIWRLLEVLEITKCQKRAYALLHQFCSCFWGATYEGNADITTIINYPCLPFLFFFIDQHMAFTNKVITQSNRDVASFIGTKQTHKRGCLLRSKQNTKRPANSNLICYGKRMVCFCRHPPQYNAIHL